MSNKDSDEEYRRLRVANWVKKQQQEVEDREFARWRTEQWIRQQQEEEREERERRERQARFVANEEVKRNLRQN